ncbi:MAG: hypothetical protein ABIQ35_11480 [Verrucomicrobiota bacterium]
MKISPLRNETPARDPHSSRLLRLSLASVAVAACLLATLLFHRDEHGFRRIGKIPHGQLQADARSVVAALRYLLEPDANSSMEIIPSTGGDAVYVLNSLERPCEMLAYSSNQLDLNAIASTNRPGRI